jgi:hypothetical protein
MDLLTLNCWVRSGNDAFQVTISKTESVSNLREAIKNKKAATFCDVDADDLALYKPKDPVSEPYEENLSKFILSENARLLKGTHELSEVFPASPPKQDIHVIVCT